MLTALFGLILSNLSDAAEKNMPKNGRSASSTVAAKTTGMKLGDKTRPFAVDRWARSTHASQAEKIAASDRADDAEFLRRAYLDIAGHIPSAEKAAAFLDSNDSGKRAKLIDELLASSDYGIHMADIWQACCCCLAKPRHSLLSRLTR